MFNAMIVAVLLALTTWYCAGQGDPGVLAARTAQRGQASAMAQYRQAVVGYFTAHPEQFQAAPVNRAGFANYRLADGTILVYALAPQPGLTAELLALSQRSHMVGRFSDGFFWPALGAAPSSIATPALAIPDGGPVWLAAAN